MQTVDWIETLDNGKIRYRREIDLTPYIIANQKRREEIGKGFSDGREMRTTYAIPTLFEVPQIDPFVYYGFFAPVKDKLSKRIALSRYPWFKICDGGVRA